MDEREFTRRVKLMTDRLWRVSYSILRSGADADDAVQEALFRAWKSVGKLKNEAYFETWLTRIVINECKRLFKKRPASPPLSEAPEAAEQDHQALHDAIGLLPLSLRVPIILYYIEGFSVKEVAGLMELGESNVKARLHRARGLLKAELIKEAAYNEPR